MLLATSVNLSVGLIRGGLRVATYSNNTQCADCQKQSPPRSAALACNVNYDIQVLKYNSFLLSGHLQALLRDLLIASEDKMQLMAGPEFVYIIAALAKLRASPDQAWLNRWLAVSRHKLSLLGPSQLVMCTRALCRLDMQPGYVGDCFFSGTLVRRSLVASLCFWLSLIAPWVT